MAGDGMQYLLFGDGSIRGVSSTPQEGVAQRVPDGAVEIDRDQFVTLAEQARQAIADQQDAARTADVQRQEADYTALSTAGLPEDLARRLSGWSVGG